MNKINKKIVEWSDCWKKIEKNYLKMHKFKFGFLQGKIKYSYKEKK